MGWLVDVVRTNSRTENVFALVIALLFCLGGFALLLSVLKLSGLMDAAVAAWVQAVVSAAAIYWAGRLGRAQLASQAEQARQAALDERKRLRRALVAVAEVALQEADSAATSAERRGQAERNYASIIYSPRTFQALTSALEAFPIYELQDPRHAATTQRLRDGFTHVDKAVADWVGIVQGKMEGALDDARAYVVQAAAYCHSQVDILRRPEERV